MLDKTLLTEEIRQWSLKTLEEKREDFNNLPACPFAKKSWNTNRVNVVVGKGGLWKDLIEYIINFDHNYDVLVYCGIDYNNLTAKEFEQRLEILLEYSIPLDLWVMGSHPDSEVTHSDIEINYNPLFEQDYYQIFVQKLSTLINASDSIFKKGYYKNYSYKNFYSLILNRRKKWLEQKRKK